MAITLSSPSTTIINLNPFSSLTVRTSAVGTIAFNSVAENIQPSFIADIQNKTYGPYGVPMSLTITMLSGSLDYIVNETLESEILTTYENLLLNFPAASNTGLKAVLSDVNNITVRSDGTRYKPVGGTAILSSLGAEIGTSGTTEVILHQAFIPAGLIKAGDTIRKQISLSKNGASETSDYSFRLGAAGTIADTQLQTFQILAAASRTLGMMAEWKVLSATTIRRIGNGSQATPFAGAATATRPDAATIPNIETNNLYLSAGILMSSTTEIVTMHAMAFEWVAS
jgi:hypothetical protein